MEIEPMPKEPVFIRINSIEVSISAIGHVIGVVPQGRLKDGGTFPLQAFQLQERQAEELIQALQGALVNLRQLDEKLKHSQQH